MTLEVPGYHTFFFQNTLVSAIAPRPEQLKPQQLLPHEIFFYIRTNTQEVSFPLPPTIPQARYLHMARIMPGHEPGGPSIALELNPSTVIGLKPYHMDGKQVCLQERFWKR